MEKCFIRKFWEALDTSYKKLKIWDSIKKIEVDLGNAIQVQFEATILWLSFKTLQLLLEAFFLKVFCLRDIKLCQLK